MSEDLDIRLKQALRPIDPGADFTASVLASVLASVSASALARAAAEPESAGHPDIIAAPLPRRRPSRLLWLPAALAASLILGVAVRYEWTQRQEAAGLEARRQLVEALRVTSSKLDLAYHLVNSPASPAAVPAEGSGA